jgi:hypothetical protein
MPEDEDDGWLIEKHANHGWEQVGNHVNCAECNVRLYSQEPDRNRVCRRPPWPIIYGIVSQHRYGPRHRQGQEPEAEADNLPHSVMTNKRLTIAEVLWENWGQWIPKGEYQEEFRDMGGFSFDRRMREVRTALVAAGRYTIERQPHGPGAWDVRMFRLVKGPNDPAPRGV